MTRKGWLAEAVKLARRAKTGQRHAAIIVRHGRMVSAAVSSRTTGYDTYSDNAWRRSCVHAEEAALSMAGSYATGATIYVARVNPAGDPVFSAPCIRCARAITRARVKSVVHT